MECRELKKGNYTFCWHVAEQYVECPCGYRCPFAEAEMKSRTSQTWTDYS